MLIRNINEISPPIKTYSCGSPNQMCFLEENGIKHIYRYIHNISGKKIWIYIMCNKLSELLTKWSKNKPIKNGGDKNGG